MNEKFAAAVKFSIVVLGVYGALQFSQDVLAQAGANISPTAADTRVQIGGLYAIIRTMVSDALSLLAFAVIGYFSMVAKTKLNITIDEGFRKSLHSAATSGINMALGQLDGKFDDLSIDVKNKILADAMNYLVRSAPGAIDHFGLRDKEKALMELLKSKLTVALPGPNA